MPASSVPRRGIRPGRTLDQATEHMRTERAYMQVYWSGAAIFLLAELELRQASGGLRSLGSALARFAACCLGVDRTSDRFPDLTAAYARLGLRPLADGGLAFEKGAEEIALRQAVMGRP